MSKTHFRGAYLLFSFPLCLSVSPRLQAFHLFVCFCRPKLEEPESFYRSGDRNVVEKQTNKKKTKHNPLKGQTLSSSIQRRRGKSCKTKT